MGETASREPIRVRVLGRFEVSVGGRRVELSSGRLRALLAVLAMSAGRPVPVDQLVDAVWGADLPADARRTMQVYVVRLRGALGPDAIATEPAGYVLCTTPDDVDALRFLRLVDRASEEKTVERHLLLEALALWRGAPFEGVPSAYLHETEAARLDERRLTSLEQRFDLDIADGRAVDVVGELGELTARYPLRESLWARLLVALARSGRPAEALETYETVRSRIAEELGVDPGAELQRIHADLLAGALPGEVDAAPSSPEAVVPRQLPADLATFTGRTPLLERLDAVLASRDEASGPRIVVVHGTGGVGKTVLATHWAHRVADDFPGGQLYLNLRGYGPGAPMRPETALDALLRGLGIEGEQIPAEVDARAGLLRSSLTDRAVLVLLDNALDADQVRPLLPGSGPSIAVITSRSQLRGLVVREGADRISVDDLDRPESLDLLAEVLGTRAVPYERSELAELAQLCGDLPLALAVAAERSSLDADAGLADLVADLRAERDRLDVLDLGDEATDLRAVFAWSYRALDVETARMFRLLGGFPGADISLAAAAALAGRTTSQTRRLLDHLVGVSLLGQRRRERYELHDLLRLYAADLARSQDPGERRSAALDRMFAWYLHSALDARKTARPGARPIAVDVESHDVEPLIFDSPDDAMSWLDTERDNLTAVTEAASQLDRPHVAYLLVSATWHYFLWIRAFDDMLRLGMLGMTAARVDGDVHAEAHCANLLAVVHAELMDLEKARELFEQAVGLFQQIGDSAIYASALDNFGVTLQRLGRSEEAVDYFESSIAMAGRVGQRESENKTQNNLATAYIALGRFKDAARLAAATAEVYRRRGDLDNEATVLDTLGQALAGQGRHAEAIERYRRSITLFDEVDDLWFKGVALTNLGRSLRAVGRLAEAREVWRDALGIFDSLGTPPGIDFSRDELVELLDDVPDDAVTT